MKSLVKWLICCSLALCFTAGAGLNESDSFSGTNATNIAVAVAETNNKSESSSKLFEGYAEGVEYEGSEDNFALTLSSGYKGHKAVPLNAYTEFFKNNAVQGEYLQGKALVSSANTKKGSLMVLQFVNPIKASEFNRLNLRVYINHQVDLLAYNADSITETELGPALETFTVNGGQYTYLTLNSALYADDNGEIGSIVFQFAEDCQPQYDSAGNMLYDKTTGEVIRDTFHFVSFNVENVEDSALVTKDSFMIVDDGESYALTFRFNKLGALSQPMLDTKKVLINGVAVSDILSECATATAEWYSAKGIYQINVTIPKSYAGKGQIKNAEYAFAGNSMSVVEGLVFPNGDVLEKSYNCHLYTGENLLDTELVKTYKPLSVEKVSFSFIADSGNLNFSIYFSGDITSSLYNHACEREDWRDNEKVKDIIGYDAGSSNIFIVGGYKSSLLDNVVINGRTIGEWHAYDPLALTSVQVHYGVGLQMNRMDVRFESATKSVYNQLYDYVQAGEGVTVEILSGLKFMTNSAVEKTQTFVMSGGKFTEQLAAKYVHVYFNGAEVKDGQEITVQTVVSDASIAVTGTKDYTVSRKDENGKKVYTVAYGENQTLTFTVTENVVVAETVEDEKQGCSSYLSVSSGIAAAVCSAWIFLRKGGKKYEE